MVCIGYFVYHAADYFTNLQWAVFLGVAFSALVAASFVARTAKEEVFGAILAALAVVVVPFLTFNVQKHTGWGFGGDMRGSAYKGYFLLVSSNWLWMEVATLASAVVLFAWQRMPFVLLPTTLTVWFMAMDYARLVADVAKKAAPAVRDADRYESSSDILFYPTAWAATSIRFGLVAVAIGLILQRLDSTRRDMSYWIFVTGAISLFIGVSIQHAVIPHMLSKDGVVNLHPYAAYCTLLILVGVVLQRNIFLVGAVGLISYFSYLFGKELVDSPLAPLLFAGMFIVGAAIVVGISRYWGAIVAPVRALVPQWVTGLLVPSAHAR
jgi:hypothetical protein